MSDTLAWLTVGAMCCGVLALIIKTWPRSGGSGRRFPGYPANGHGPVTIGDGTTDFTGISVGYERSQDEGAGESSTDTVNGEMRDG